MRVVSEKEYFGVAILFLAYSLCFGLILNFIPLSLLVLYLIIFVVYSVPPMRLRRHVFGSFLIGGCLALAFLFGYTSQAASINSPIIPVSLLLFVGSSVGVIAKDFKDYQGDKSDNVKTVFTVLGLRKGIRFTSILLLISFLLPLLLLNSAKDVLFFAGLAILSSVDFRIRTNFDRTIFWRLCFTER
jgi:4-hydroxybenzoate polyprenyltransferase